MSKQPPTDEFGDANEGTNSVNRRRFVKSLGAAGGVGAFGATGMTGNAAAEESQEPLVDPSEFDTDITSTNSAVNYTETDVTSGSPSTDPAPTPQAIASPSARFYVATIPYRIPVIGGTDIVLTIDATFGFTEVSISGGICFDNTCLTLLGAGISYSNAEICADIRGKLKAIPLRVDGCFRFAPSLNPAGLEVSASVEVCLDVAPDSAYEQNGWEFAGRYLCVQEDVGGTL
ncbi:twin-arginine translocation signal domain-containing protein [Halococcus saccharolyticus]|nr:twin-arginine translocation signal domain-containing protein [Halococcus saccharolyticus]